MAGSFRERARFEASRYGSDPWVFVRELLQNARDAGARRIAFEARGEGAGVRISCRDDGAGMTFAHARRFLFTLYTSSKERDVTSAGRFGVGFWSILRFEPERIAIRSWPRRGTPWQVVLEGDLAHGSQGRPEDGGPPGTEVVLVRSRAEADLERRVYDTAWRAGRFLARRDRPGEPLLVTVNGRSVNAPFRLPPPSLSFRRARLRGAVGLGSAPAVELFSKGLHVRSAPCLHDLLSPAPAGREEERAAPTTSIEGVAPRGLIESDEIELLLARGDARDDRALRRLVRLAQRETDRLLARQLDCLRPRPMWERIGTGVGLAGAALLAAALGAGGLWRDGVARSRASAPDAAEASIGPSAGRGASGLVAAPAADAPTIGYHDLGGGYPGPRMEGLDQSFAPIRLRYAPAPLRLHLAALIVTGLDERGRVKPAPADVLLTAPRYEGSPCETDCVDVQLLVAGGGAAIRLPVPTGHRLEPGSVVVAGRPLAVLVSPAGQPIVRPQGQGPILIGYRTGSDPRDSGDDPEPSALPAAAERAAAGLRLLPREARVAPAIDWVRTAVRYSTAPDVIARHRAAEAEGQGFVERSLAVGAGDCDVQNGVLALVLQASGVPARLAIGYLGEAGSVAPWLHAWVEYADRPGPWRVADASQGASPAARAIARPTPTGVTAPLPAVRGRSKLGPAALAGGVTLAAVAVALARRTRRRLRLDPRGDLPRLLLGALQQPEAFGAGSAVFHRRLLPLAGGRPLSLARAWDLAARGELYATRGRGALARQAARRGWRVVDASRPEGSTVAEALGAIDLDEWERLLARSRTCPLLDALNRHLRGRGEGWSVRMAPGVAPSPTVVRLPRPVLWGARPDRVVVLDENEAWLASATSAAGTRPAEALFTVADRLAGILDLEGRRPERLLAPLARDAAREAGPC